MSTALISPCGLYRYELGRCWQPNPSPAGLRRVLWIMLNPSTADAEKDDPTIRRCIGFSKLWGYDGIQVVNLFALRATDPRMLFKHFDPIGPENDQAILRGAISSHLVIAAWGNHGQHLGRGRTVRALVDCPIYHLGLTQAGQPKHPLYLSNQTLPTLWVD